MNELIIYTTEDGRSRFKLRTDQQTVSLTQLDIAKLFDATTHSISLHLKNIFQDGEPGLAASAAGQAFPIRDALRRELSWTHYRPLRRADSDAAT